MDDRDGDTGGLPRTAARLVLLVLAVVVVAALAGFVFGRTDPRRAAALLVDDFVNDEPAGTVTVPPAPTSGEIESDTPASCGVMAEAVPVERQIASLRAGVVVVQYGGNADGEALAGWAADRVERVLLAPSQRIDDPVVATAWGRRLVLAEANEELLTAFVAAYGGAGPDGGGCDQ